MKRRSWVGPSSATSAVASSSGVGLHEVHFDDGETVTAKSVIIATGARYNRLPLDRLSDFEGVGVYYAATQMEAKACGGGPVLIVGGETWPAKRRSISRRHLHRRAHCHPGGIARELDVALIDRPDRAPSPYPRLWHAPRSPLVGEQRLEGVHLRDNVTEETSVVPVCGLFVFIGAAPCTGWLSGQLAEDEHGFLLTGADLAARGYERREVPLVLETSTSGIFCVGDVRSRSIKRVAAAVGKRSTWRYASCSSALKQVGSWHQSHQEGVEMDDERIDPSAPPSGTGCVECLAVDGWWSSATRPRS